jgi:hypothetical protein
MTVVAPDTLGQARELITPTLRQMVDRLDPAIGLVVSYHLGWCDEQGQPMTNCGGKAIRPGLARTITITNLAVRRDAVLRRLFEYAWRDLPLTDLGPDWSAVTRQGVRNTERIADMLAPGLWRNG